MQKIVASHRGTKKIIVIECSTRGTEVGRKNEEIENNEKKKLENWRVTILVFQYE